MPAYGNTSSLVGTSEAFKTLSIFNFFFYLYHQNNEISILRFWIGVLGSGSTWRFGTNFSGAGASLIPQTSSRLGISGNGIIGQLIIFPGKNLELNPFHLKLELFNFI